MTVTPVTGNGDRIFLDSSIARCMINIDAVLGHDFFEIPIRYRKPNVEIDRV